MQQKQAKYAAKDMQICTFNYRFQLISGLILAKKSSKYLFFFGYYSHILYYICLKNLKLENMQENPKKSDKICSFRPKSPKYAKTCKIKKNKHRILNQRRLKRTDTKGHEKPRPGY